MTPESPNGSEQTTQDEKHTLTARQGHPVVDNQNLRTVGGRGPGALENYQVIAILRIPSHRDGDRRDQPLPGIRPLAAALPHHKVADPRWC